MPELISSPLFLIVAAAVAIFIIIGIIKQAFRFVIWIVIIFVILISFSIVKQADLLGWFENLRKWF